MVTHSKRVIVVLTVGLLLVSAGSLGGVAALDGGESQSDSDSGSESEDEDENESGTADADTGDVSEAEILSQIDETETYRFELNQSTETPEGNVTVTANGTVDEPNERLYTSMTQEMDVGLGGAIEMEQYIVGDTQYVLLQGVWQQMEIPEEEDIWEQEQDELSEQGDVIESGELEVVGTESVDGVETTVVRVDGTDELIDELEGDVDGERQRRQGMQEDVSIENVTYHFYVDEETHTLHRTEMELTMDRAGQTVRTTMELTFFEHDEPVDIELPEEAEDAQEVGGDGTTDSA